MTEEEIEALAILHKGVSMATTWHIEADEITTDDVRECVAALPKLVAKIRSLQAQLEEASLYATFACEAPCGDCRGCQAALDHHRSEVAEVAEAATGRKGGK